MRLIRLQLSSSATRYLALLTQQFALDDIGIAEDLFALFRQNGAGLPTDEAITLLAEQLSKKTKVPQSLVSIQLKKRRQMLRELSSTTYFKALCLSCKAEPHKAVSRLLSTTQTFMRKRRAASCLSCNLRSGCAYGKQYGDVVTDITKVVDPKFNTMVDPNCPDKPEIEKFNEFAAEAMKMAQLDGDSAEGISAAATVAGGADFLEQEEKAEEQFDASGEFGADEDSRRDEEEADETNTIEDDGLDPDQDEEPVSFVGGASKTGSNKLTFTGTSFAKVQEDFVNRLSMSSLQLFELGRVLDGMLASELSGKFVPVETFDAEQRTRNIQTLSEMTSANLAEHAMPEILDAKVAKQELSITKHSKPTLAKSLLYILIDASGSMNTRVCDGNPHFLLTRAQTCASFAAALAMRVTSDAGIIHVRYFDGSLMDRFKASSKEEGKHIARMISRCNMWGGGTNISRAIQGAISDVAVMSSNQKLAKAEILLISDMDDSIDAGDRSRIVSTTGDGKTAPRLSVFDINAGRKHGNAHQVLKAIASKYFCVSPQNLDLSKLVQLVK